MPIPREKRSVTLTALQSSSTDLLKNILVFLQKALLGGRRTRWSGQSHVKMEEDTSKPTFSAMGDVKSLNTVVPIMINGISLPRTALGEEDGSLDVIGMDLGSTPQLHRASCCQ